MYGGNARSDGNYIVRGGAVAVPADFVGMHFRGWPIFNAPYWASASQPYPTAPSPAPSIGFGCWRSHDSGWARWNQIETTQGGYDWSNLDVLITTHRSAGRTVIYCPTGVPVIYLSASNPARGTASQESVYPDSSSPSGITAWANFITALVIRYNDPNGAWRLAHPTLGKGIQAIELWNEPVFGSDGRGGFWDDTVGTLIDLCKTTRQAAKAVDAQIIIASPGFVAPNTMQMFLQATGTINTGTTGLSLCDVICIHYYRILPPGAGFSNFDIALLERDAYLRTVMANCGAAGLPVWGSEVGIDYASPNVSLTTIAAQPPEWRYRWWARILMTAAALGYQKFISYAWDTPYLVYPCNDPQGTAKAVNDVHVNVAGKTIKNAFYDVGGAVTLQFSDGSTFSV